MTFPNSKLKAFTFYFTKVNYDITTIRLVKYFLNFLQMTSTTELARNTNGWLNIYIYAPYMYKFECNINIAFLYAYQYAHVCGTFRHRYRDIYDILPLPLSVCLCVFPSRLQWMYEYMNAFMCRWINWLFKYNKNILCVYMYMYIYACIGIPSISDKFTNMIKFTLYLTLITYQIQVSKI